MLTEKDKRRRMVRPTTVTDELRYRSVKKSMTAIKVVLAERQRLGLETEQQVTSQLRKSSLNSAKK